MCAEIQNILLTLVNEIYFVDISFLCCGSEKFGTGLTFAALICFCCLNHLDIILD